MKISRTCAVTLLVVVFVLALGTAHAGRSSGRRSGGSSKSSGGSKSKSRTSGSSGTSSHSGGSYQHREREKQSGSSYEVQTGHRSGGKTSSISKPAASQSHKINNAFIHSESKSPSSDLSSFLSRMDSYSRHSKQKPSKTTHNSTSIGFHVPYQRTRSNSSSNHYHIGNHTQQVKATMPPKNPIYRSNSSSSHNTSTGNSFYNKTASHGTQGFNYSSSSISKVSPSAPAEEGSVGNQPVGWNVPANPQNQPVGWNVPANPQTHQGLPIQQNVLQQKPSAPELPLNSNAWANPNYPPQNPPPQNAYPGSVPNPQPGWNVQPQYPQRIPQGNPGQGTYPAGQGAYPAGQGTYPGQSVFPHSGMTGVDPNLGRYGVGVNGYPQPGQLSYGQGGVPQNPFQNGFSYPGSGIPVGQVAYPGQVPYPGNNWYPSASKLGSYPRTGYYLPGGMSYPGNYRSYGGNYYGKPSGGTDGLGKVGAAAAGVVGGMEIESRIQRIQKALGAIQKRSKDVFLRLLIGVMMDAISPAPSNPLSTIHPFPSRSPRSAATGRPNSTDTTPNAISTYSSEATTLAPLVTTIKAH